MMKYVFVLCIAVALMHESQAFKVITFQTAIQGNSAPASAPASNAVDPSAILQSVQSALASKLQQVQTLVGSLVQQKVALKQNAFNSLQSTVTGFKSQLGSVAGNVRPPFVIRKQIYVGAAPAKPPAAAASETTTSVDVDATTTSN